MDACETQGRREEPGGELGLRKRVRQPFDRRIVNGNARPDRRDGLEDDSSYR